MWKCPYCDELITDAAYEMQKDYGCCDCDEDAYYWKFDSIIIDKDEKGDQTPPEKSLIAFLMAERMDRHLDEYLMFCSRCWVNKDIKGENVPMLWNSWIQSEMI